MEILDPGVRISTDENGQISNPIFLKLTGQVEASKLQEGNNRGMLIYGTFTSV